MAKRRVGVEYSPSTLEPVRPGAVSPERGVVLADIHSHLLIVNKPLSLSLSLSNLDDVLQGWGQVCNIIRQSLPNGSIFENLKGLHPSSLLLRYCSLSPAP